MDNKTKYRKTQNLKLTTKHNHSVSKNEQQNIMHGEFKI